MKAKQFGQNPKNPYIYVREKKSCSISVYREKVGSSSISAPKLSRVASNLGIVSLVFLSHYSFCLKIFLKTIIFIFAKCSWGKVEPTSLMGRF